MGKKPLKNSDDYWKTAGDVKQDLKKHIASKYRLPREGQPKSTPPPTSKTSGGVSTDI